MTLKSFLMACGGENVLISLFHEGDTKPFATLSSSTAEYLDNSIADDVVESYTIVSLTKMSAIVSVTDNTQDTGSGTGNTSGDGDGLDGNLDIGGNTNTGNQDSGQNNGEPNTNTEP